MPIALKTIINSSGKLYHKAPLIQRITALLRRHEAKVRLRQADARYEAARAEWRAARDRQDTRRMNAASSALRVAHYELLAAEAACLPRPAPLARRAV